jgi:uncharacterized membrane protein
MQLSSPYPASVYVSIAGGLILLILVARWFAISPRLRKWWLFVPRCLVLATLLLIFLNPVERSEQRLPPRPASVAFLVDCSRSMALDRPISRIRQAQATLQTAVQLARNDVPPRVQLFGFGRQLAVAPDIAGLRARDDATDLQTALRQLPSRFTGDPPQVLVVLSDGAAQETGELANLSVAYRDLGLPIHVFPIGDQGTIGDVAIDQLIVPRRVEPGVQVPLRLTLRQTGFDQVRVVVQVRPTGRLQGGEPLASLPVTLNQGVQTCELVLGVDPDVGDLVVDLPVLAGEAVTENNRVPFRLFRRDRKVRVLYMEGTTGSEYRWIQNALQEDPDIQCLSMVVNHQYTQRPRLQRIGDPYRGYPTTREELLQFDVVICSDISQGAFTREQIEWTTELVGERGGGFAMVGGHTSFGSGGWDQTAWDKLIPFDMAGRRDYLHVDFHVEIPEDARTHPIWHLVDDPVQNQRVLRQMPLFHGTNLITRVKPAAVALGFSNRVLPRVGRMPIFGCETYGRGRTFAMATDSTYAWGVDFERRWGEGGDNRHFRKFWRNVVRWLSENSLAGSRRLHVDTDKLIYRPGETVRLTATAFDESLEQTTSYELTAGWVAADDKPKAPLPVDLTADPALQVYKGELPTRVSRGLTVQPSGSDAVMHAAQLRVVAAGSGKEVARTDVDIQLLEDSVEFLDPRPAWENLETLATLSGGRMLRGSAELAELLRDLQRSEGEVLVHQTPLWDRWWLWLFLLGILTVEWSLRRRAGFG